MRKKKLERAMGIEPTLLAWEAKVLPLNYARLVWRLLYANFQPDQRLTSQKPAKPASLHNFQPTATTRCHPQEYAGAPFANGGQ